jgi:holliday junction DNA helicase RuvA
MYAFLKGKLVEKNPTHVVIDCNGVGYMVHISLYTFSQLKDQENVQLLTHFVVREDAHILYGFADDQERELFKHLISVSGVGPNTARMVQSSLTPNELFEAILSNNTFAIQAVKGIGSKTAQRIILDLKDKLQKGGLPAEISQGVHNTNKEEALTALITLGFAKQVAEKAINKLILEQKETLSVEDIIRKVLQQL